MRIFFSCKEAEKWNWLSYTPSGMDGAKFYTYLFMAEVINFTNNYYYFNFVFAQTKETFPNQLTRLPVPYFQQQKVRSWLLSIMPNRPVRDKWDYPRKMERHFPIKPPTNKNSSCHFLSFPNSLIRAKNRFVKNGTANFDPNIPTEISGPPPEVIPNNPVGRNRNGPFHLNSDRNSRIFWHNGEHPMGSWFVASNSATS